MHSAHAMKALKLTAVVSATAMTSMYCESSPLQTLCGSVPTQDGPLLR